MFMATCDSVLFLPPFYRWGKSDWSQRLRIARLPERRQILCEMYSTGDSFYQKEDNVANTKLETKLEYFMLIKKNNHKDLLETWRFTTLSSKISLATSGLLHRNTSWLHLDFPFSLEHSTVAHAKKGPWYLSFSSLRVNMPLPQSNLSEPLFSHPQHGATTCLSYRILGEVKGFCTHKSS